MKGKALAYIRYLWPGLASLGNPPRCISKPPVSPLASQISAHRKMSVSSLLSALNTSRSPAAGATSRVPAGRRACCYRWGRAAPDTAAIAKLACNHKHLLEEGDGLAHFPQSGVGNPQVAKVNAFHHPVLQVASGGKSRFQPGDTLAGVLAQAKQAPPRGISAGRLSGRTRSAVT